MIKDSLGIIQAHVGTQATLVVVSKGRSLDDILSLYALGIRDFGENRLAEALTKMEAAPKDIRWHFIGRIQKNKISKLVSHFALIHSADSVEVVKALSKASEKQGCVTCLLLQANTSGETSKAGSSPEEWKASIGELALLPGVKILGLMTMAPLTTDDTILRHTFQTLRLLRDELEKISFLKLNILSMGMSGDYKIALEEGSTLVRIGSAIFGAYE